MINPPRPRPTVTPTTGVSGKPTPVPSPSSGPTPTKVGENLKLPRLPGAFTISPGDPIGGAAENQRQSDLFINGLGQSLFGKGTGSVFGGIPGLGEAVRAASAVPGVELVSRGVGSVLGLGVGQAVHVAERIPLGWLPGGSDETFNALPRTPDWHAVNDAANQDFLAGGNQKFDYTKKVLEEAQAGIRDPNGLMTLSPGLLAGPGGSAGALVGQLLGLFQLPQRYVERGLAGTAKALSGMNRVQEVAARAAHGEELSPVEMAAVTNVANGSWTEERALDFLASHGAGLSSNALLQVAGSFATDPVVLASLGSGILSRVAGRGAALLETPSVPVTGRFNTAAVSLANMQRGPVGHAFRDARLIFDPLAYFGNKTPAGKAAVNSLVDTAGTRSWWLAHEGDGGIGAFRMVQELGMNTDAFLAAAAGRAATNLGDVLALHARDRIIKTYVDLDWADSVDETVGRMLPVTPDDVMRFMREQAFKHRESITEGRPWDDVSKTQLAINFARRFDGDPDAVTKAFLKASDSRLGLYHDALYAGDGAAFDAAYQVGREAYTGSVPYDRLNMMNASTLTDLGAAGFLKSVGAGAEARAAREALQEEFPDAAARATDKGRAAVLAFETKFPLVSDDEASALLAELQTKFPAALRYRQNVQFAIDDLSRKLEAGLDGGLPHQVVSGEMDEMPEEIQAFFRDNPHRTLGFSPPEETRWSIERDPVTGQYAPDGDPWTGHRLNGVPYRPGHLLQFNLAGQPLPVRAVVRALDNVEAGVRLMTNRVAGTQIREGAQQRFVKNALATEGMTETLARRVFERMTEHLDVSTRPTITSEKMTELHKLAREVLPPGVNVDERDVLRWVVNGFEGNIDHVGLAQKLVNRVRTRYTELAGNNALYEVSQHLYSELKFRFPGISAKFKAQETVEPFFINAAEGSGLPRREVAPGSVEDQIEGMLNNLDSTSLLNLARQTDLLEQSPWTLRGAKAELGKKLPLLNRVLNPAISEYKRGAQLSMMKARLGVATRQAFEVDGQLDDFIEFKNEYSKMMGYSVDDAEYAAHWMNHMMSSSLSLDNGGQRLNLATVFHEFETYFPADLGPLRLGLDMAAARLDGTKGWKIGNLNDLVTAMTPSNKVAADDLIRESDIRELFGSAKVAAPPGYVDRFMTALNFDWGRFWKTATVRYHLDPEQSKRLQTFVAMTAHTQGMKPTEFLSQVVSSGMKQEWTEEEIMKNVALGLNVLVTKPGGTADDLAKQLSEIFIDHLHPSGRAALARAYSATDETLDSIFAERLIERVTSGKPSTDPNLENAYSYFGEWARAALTDSALGHAENPLLEMLKKVAPGGKPFDHTQGALVDAVLAGLRRTENDTYRAQFFARDRTVIERSINHPMFGLYPASYMWFKIFPLLMKFIAKSPFGIKTGAVAYALADIQRDVQIQSEFDPEFEELLAGVDGNAAMWALSYMIPATPWDIPAQWPAWIRDFAGQGLANQRRVEEGKPPKGLDVSSIAKRMFNPLDPFATPKLAFDTLGAVGDFLTGTQEEQEATPGAAGVTSQIAGPVQELAEPLSDAMAELERILAQQ